MQTILSIRTGPSPRPPASGQRRTVELPLKHDRSAPAAARRATRDALAGRSGWHEERVYQAMLVASELVTNAVTHARPPITLRLELARSPEERLRIQVTDGGADPARRTPRPAGECGRGLVVVTTLARRGGVTDDEASGRSTRWAELTPPGDPADAGASPPGGGCSRGIGHPAGTPPPGNAIE